MECIMDYVPQHEDDEGGLPYPSEVQGLFNRLCGMSVELLKQLYLNPHTYMQPSDIPSTMESPQFNQLDFEELEIKYAVWEYVHTGKQRRGWRLLAKTEQGWQLTRVGRMVGAAGEKLNWKRYKDMPGYVKFEDEWGEDAYEQGQWYPGMSWDDYH